jgi:hypothetical protein
MCLYFRAITQGGSGIIQPVYEWLHRMLLQFSSFYFCGPSTSSRAVILIVLTSRDANKYHLEGN